MLRSKTLSSLGVTEPADGKTDKFLAAKRSARSAPPARPLTPPSPTGSEIVDVEKLSGCEESPVKTELAAEPEKRPPETVDEILQRLPPVDLDAIRWSDEEDADCDDDEDEEPEPKPVTAVDVHKLLSSHVEGLNGNRTDGVCPHVGDAPHGLRASLPATYGATEPSCPEDCLFREWHETLSRTSYQGELLHILPYVIIDWTPCLPLKNPPSLWKTMHYFFSLFCYFIIKLLGFILFLNFFLWEITLNKTEITIKRTPSDWRSDTTECKKKI